MSPLPHDNIKPFAAEGEKRQQVSQMFDDIAPRYDFMNHFLSAGIDRSWRKKAIEEFKAAPPKHLLDVATGTADMAIMAAKNLGLQKITGIDISENMLHIGRQKIGKEGLQNKITLHSGDSENMPFHDAAFDGVMAAFGVRNFQNLDKGLHEMYRVLQPGAKAVILEFSKPVIPGVKALYNLYMGIIAPQVAGVFTKNKRAYQYLNKSSKAFPGRQQFVNILKSAGFTNASFKPLTLGICCIYVAHKPN